MDMQDPSRPFYRPEQRWLHHNRFPNLGPAGQLSELHHDYLLAGGKLSRSLHSGGIRVRWKLSVGSDPPTTPLSHFPAAASQNDVKRSIPETAASSGRDGGQGREWAESDVTE